MSSPKREQLIDKAAELFYRDGFHATGIDKILAESGVAKMTLYKHFKSKDELILAALHKRDEIFRNDFMRAVESRAKEPRARLLALFDTLAEWFDKCDFSGCMFINAAAEYPDSDCSIHNACAEHKRLILNYVTGLAREAGAKDPDALANGITFLMEGAIVMYHAGLQKDAAHRAKETAETLIKAAID